MRLLEHESKARLARAGVRVPRGAVATTPEQAGSAARALDGEVFVKALVPANRRSKNNGVIGPIGRDAAARAAHELLGSRILGHRCRSVYVEEAVAVAGELYTAFSWGPRGPRVTASGAGGVDIESSGDAMVHLDLEGLAELPQDGAERLWRRALGDARVPPALVELTVSAAGVFFDDALLVELNPLARSADGLFIAVGALIEMDGNALFRHPELRWRPDGFSEREAVVAEADRRLPGASVRYVELDGDTGLLVGGGGAGLYQHDLLVQAGMRPANHSDLGAGVSAEKLDVLIEAVLGHPNLSRLLVSFNILQLAPCDLIMERLLMGLDRLGDRDGPIPVVVRLEGLNADRARRLAAGRAGLRYLPSGASLGEAVDTLVRISR
ncbi:MAG: acetate--CoA ligase family protein [bacterium]|nr:acetate--CoA ligase family protein [bacterium]